LLYAVRAARLCPTVKHVVVATDSMLVAHAVAGEAVVWVDQDDDSWCGSQRIARALVKLPERYADVDIVVNWQADEPEIRAQDADRLVRRAHAATSDDFDVVTAVGPFRRSSAQQPHTVKAILDEHGVADFRRSVRPESTGFYPHVGIYAMRPEALAQLVAMAPSVRSIAESLEQLTWLDNGWKVDAIDIDYEPLGINDGADYQRFIYRQKDTQ